MTLQTLTPTTVTSTEAGATRRDSPAEVTAEAGEATMTARALAEEREDLASVEERLEDAEASEAAEAVTLEVRSYIIFPAFILNNREGFQKKLASVKPPKHSLIGLIFS